MSWWDSSCTVDGAWTIFTLHCVSASLCWVVSPWDTKRGFSLSDNIQQLSHTHMLEISLEVLEGRKLLERKDLWLQTVSLSQKAKKKNYPGTEDTECVCGPFSRRATWWGSCQPAGRWLSPSERSRRRRRRRRARHSSALTPSLRLRAAVEEKLRGDWKKEKDGSGSLFCWNKTQVPLGEKSDWTALCVRLNGCEQIRLEVHC